MAPQTRTPPMLTVKQLIPPVRETAVPRRRLTEQLDASRARLTIVVAPAGWGKTSVLSAWARSVDHDLRVAWVSLDESDDDPGRFWRYVLTALIGVSDDLSAASVEALSSADLAATELALPVLLNELAATTTRHALVLDDYHALSDPRIHEEVEFLLNYVPESLRLVIAGRADPPLPLARLRARGDLTELRAAELTFDPDEGAALVSKVSGVALDSGANEALWRRTEGWAAGLQLSGLALRSDPERLRVGERHLLDYFATEVLPGLAPTQRRLLEGCAPLELLTGALCDAVLQETHSSDVLDELVRGDLFVAPLDDQQQWYRCHRLLRDALIDQADADTDGVLERAATWFAEHDRIDDAVDHLLRAERYDLAADLLLRKAESWFLARGAATTFVRLGERLPVHAVGASLAYFITYAAALCGERDRVVRWLDLGEGKYSSDAVAPGWHSYQAAFLVLRANFGVTDADSARAVELARRAVALETEGGRPGHPVVHWGLGASLARNGQFEDSANTLNRLWADEDRNTWPPWLVLSVAGTFVVALLQAERLDECDAALRSVETLANDVERAAGRAITPGVSALRLAAGRRSYQRGSAEAAAVQLRHAVELVQLHPRPTLLVLALAYLAEAELAVGDRGAAQACLRRARDITDEEPVSAFVFARLEAVETRLGRGAVRAARQSGSMVEELTDRELSILRMLQGTATQREIAAAMFLSVNTVKSYNKSLYRKLGVASRAEAVVTARELGLI